MGRYMVNFISFPILVTTRFVDVGLTEIWDHSFGDFLKKVSTLPWESGLQFGQFLVQRLLLPAPTLPTTNDMLPRAGSKELGELDDTSQKALLAEPKAGYIR